ncbi:PBPRA1643 family SWIM/SEC-C metal-binding motif protein [Caballeronia sp. LZ065]|nr:PBPRA1643 family SWIM/SEC-C metal-binding motif protein [Caballeronia sp. LZ065]
MLHETGVRVNLRPLTAITGSNMPKIGSEQRPIIVRVTSDDRAHYVAQVCQQNGWHYIIGFEGSEDISDLENALNPPLPMQSTKVERNIPCPCGSGRKYKKCCGS